MKLGGLGAELFDSCATALMEIQQVLSMSLPPSAMEPWSPSMDRGCMTLEMSNRYFASRSDTPEEEVPVTSAMDPLHILRSHSPPGGRHTKDNVVLYYDRQGSAGYVGYRHGLYVLCSNLTGHTNTSLSTQQRFRWEIWWKRK